MIEPEEEGKDDRTGLVDKIGDIVIVQDDAKKDITRIASRTRESLKGKPQEKPKQRRGVMKLPRMFPYGDEKSIRKTIGAAVLTLAIIAGISLAASLILATTTALFQNFGTIGTIIIIFVGVSVPVGIVAFFFATVNKHEDEKHIEEALRR